MHGTAGKVVSLLDPATRRRWLALCLLSLLVSGSEALAAVLVFVLLGSITAPDPDVVLPIVGNLGKRFPALDEDRLLGYLALAVGAFFIVRGCLYLFQSYVQNRVAYNAGARLAERLLTGYLAMPYETHLRRNSSELVRNAHESAQLFSQNVLVPGIVLASESMLVLALVVVLLVTSPVATAVAVAAMGLVVLLLLRRVQPALVRHGEAAQELSRQSLQTLQQTLQGLREIMLADRRRFFQDEFRVTRQALARAYYSRAVLVDVPRIVLETVVFVFVMSFIAASTLLGGSTSSVLAVLGLFAYAVLRVLPSLNRIMVNLNAIKFSVPLVDDLHSDCIAADAAVAVAPPDSSDVPFTEEVRLDHVTYRYPDAPVDALADVSLVIARGESIGVVGTTGGGKSTLLDVLLGLLTPQHGALLVDGTGVAGRERAWQQRIGAVSQDVFLLDDSIAANIALGVPAEHVDSSALADAVAGARLTSFVAALPDGLATVVGERGVALSGGQRQRVAIARALYRRPDVLVFDEGTSALDTVTEAEIMAALQALRGVKTLVLVAHRLSTVQQCDRIVLVDQGRIAAEGSYEDLMQGSAAFRRIAG